MENEGYMNGKDKVQVSNEVLFETEKAKLLIRFFKKRNQTRKIF